MTKNTKFGALYIVATPIGNLEDMHRNGYKEKFDLKQESNNERKEYLVI